VTYARHPGPTRQRTKGRKVHKPTSPDQTWTNHDIAENPDGYKLAQERYLEDAQAYQERRRQEDDKERFVEEFIAAGGVDADADKVWKTLRKQRAAEQAAAHSEAALRSSRQHVSRGL